MQLRLGAPDIGPAAHEIRGQADRNFRGLGRDCRHRGKLCHKRRGLARQQHRQAVDRLLGRAFKHRNLRAGGCRLAPGIGRIEAVCKARLIALARNFRVCSWAARFFFAISICC